MDNCVKTYIRKMSLLLDLMTSDDELTDNDKASIINTGVLEMQTKIYNIKKAYGDIDHTK